MSWHHHHLLCGRSETLPANNIGDQCAAVGKVLRSLAMLTSVHDDTKLSLSADYGVQTSAERITTSAPPVSPQDGPVTSTPLLKSLWLS